MRVKVFADASEKKLEEKVNRFLAGSNIEVKHIKFAGAGFAVWPTFGAMIVYEELAQ